MPDFLSRQAATCDVLRERLTIHDDRMSMVGVEPACGLRLRSSIAIRCFRSPNMTPLVAKARFAELGVSLEVVEFPHVQRLDVCEDPISPEHLDSVKELFPRTVTLYGALMTAQDIPALLHFSSLQSIVAHGLDFANELLRHAAGFPQLKSVAMARTTVTDLHVAALAKCSELTYLNFAGTQLTDVALKTFGTLSGLELLSLRNTLVTDDGLQHLHQLRNLFTVDVRGTTVTAAGADRFCHLVAGFLPDVEVLI